MKTSLLHSAVLTKAPTLGTDGQTQGHSIYCASIQHHAGIESHHFKYDTTTVYAE